jgi:hypothetical protein
MSAFRISPPRTPIIDPASYPHKEPLGVPGVAFWVASNSRPNGSKPAQQGDSSRYPPRPENTATKRPPGGSGQMRAGAWASPARRRMRSACAREPPGSTAISTARCEPAATSLRESERDWFHREPVDPHRPSLVGRHRHGQREGAGRDQLSRLQSWVIGQSLQPFRSDAPLRSADFPPAPLHLIQNGRTRRMLREVVGRSKCSPESAASEACLRARERLDRGAAISSSPGGELSGERSDLDSESQVTHSRERSSADMVVRHSALASPRRSLAGAPWTPYADCGGAIVTR